MQVPVQLPMDGVWTTFTIVTVVVFVSFPAANEDKDTQKSCPADMVLVPESKSCIDRYEWPNKKGESPLVGATATQSIWDKKKGIQMDAESLCASVGKRMCQLNEWVSSCKGKGGTDYPFGRKLPKKRPEPEDAPCNYTQWFKKPDYRKVFIRDPEEMSRLNQSDKSGDRGCVSGGGAEDMMGNVEEWIHCPSWLSSNCTGKGTDKVCYCLAGRYWSAPATCDKVIVSHAPVYHDYETGFRCCSSLNSD